MRDVGGSTGGGAAREVGAAIRGAMREVPPVVRYGRAVREVRGVREVPRGRDMGCGAGGSTGGEAFGEGGYIGGRPDSGSGAGDGVWCERSHRWGSRYGLQRGRYGVRHERFRRCNR